MFIENLFLFVLSSNGPVNNFSVISGWSDPFLGSNQYSGVLMCLAQGHNTVQPVGIEPRTSPFTVKCHTTTSPCSPIENIEQAKLKKGHKIILLIT